MASEVKKIKTVNDIYWQFAVNRLHFEFNSEDEDSLKQKLWALEYEKREYTIELHNDSFDKLKPRNKHSRIADSAEGGLETAPAC